MANSRLTSEYEQIFLLNLSLLEMARQGSWQDFSRLAENYVVQLNQLMQHQPALEACEREELKQILQTLLDNENEMMQALSQRLTTLKQEMVTLGRGKQCAQAYASLLPTRMH